MKRHFPSIAGPLFATASITSTAGITYLIETSEKLVTWQTTGATLTAPDGSGLRNATLPVDSTPRFMRLAVGC